ncbi:gephyrin-like molybdotransferase Glp [Proteiniborus sp. MB09-C3]|uniref:molybdopterin molybdotransferase MoeA n=1 Tax=Proteiniborus sp. MB09-C3 TaxID=3050072 RepID=UPI0025523569|nr:gephyrin-like molybdotransferase Glp [Proteiniborus sp. MB09-C3]WIV12575.1 molybdopterin molybdotransferase MoeA [Proteiniborus sp. MB09-C3]
MDFFNAVSVEEGKRMMIEVFREYSFEIEEISMLDATNRVLADDIVANNNVPEFNRSTVDGYAVKSSDTHGASESIPSFLTLLGEIRMGQKADIRISSGEAIYVPTGGMIPEGADAVIMIEYAEKLDDSTLMVYRPLSVGENIILKGDDIKEGERVIEKGKRLNSQDIGVLAALGISEIRVYKKPRFFIISTGDEIVDLNEELTMGKVRDVNSYALHSLIIKLGGEVSGKAIVRDDFELLRSSVENALEISDIVIISGGSSVGTRDYTSKVINSFSGKGVFVHGVSIKPGKPTIIGEGKGKAIFGLPGHPVSSIIVFKVFIEYFIKHLLNVKESVNKTTAILDFNFPSSPGKETYQMVNIRERNGKTYAIPSFGKSGMITLLSKSDGYIVLKPHEEGISKGEIREVYFL